MVLLRVVGAALEVGKREPVVCVHKSDKLLIVRFDAQLPEETRDALRGTASAMRATATEDASGLCVCCSTCCRHLHIQYARLAGTVAGTVDLHSVG